MNKRDLEKYAELLIKTGVNLQKGDIIKLDSAVGDELEVYVGNIKKFKE